MESVAKPPALKALAADKENTVQQQATAEGRERVLLEKAKRECQRECNRLPKKALTPQKQREVEEAA